MKDYDFSAFEKEKKDYDFSAFEKKAEEPAMANKTVEALPSSQESDTLDDFLTGAIQGATLGFSDEIGAAIDILRGRTPADAKTKLEAFRILQKAREAENELAKERSPVATLAGELAGGFAIPVPGALAAGAGKAGLAPLLSKLGFGERLAGHIGSGAAIGAAAGLGTSKGQLEESPGEVLKDIGVGAGFGGVTGGLLGTAADKLSDTSKYLMERPSVQKGLASHQMAAGTRPGYEAPLDVYDAPEINPLLPRSGGQQIVAKVEQDAKELAENAFNVRKGAKTDLSDEIKSNANKNTFLPKGVSQKEIASKIEENMQNVYSNAIDDTISMAQRDPILKDVLNEKISSFAGTLSPKEKPVAAIKELLKENNARVNDLFEFAFERNRLNSINSVFDEYASIDPKGVEAIKFFRQIGNAKGRDPLVRIRNLIEQIDNDFMNAVKSDRGVNLNSLFNFRTAFRRNVSNYAEEMRLSPKEREILFGIKDEATGKYSGGIYEKIENLLRNTSPELNNAINAVDQKSRHIETLLNNTEDPKFHGTKAWDYPDAELHNELKNEFQKIIEDIGSSTTSAQKSGEKMRRYLGELLKMAETPEDRMKVEEFVNTISKKVKPTAYEYSALESTQQIDRTSDIPSGALDPTKIQQRIKSSGVSELGAVTGRMQRSVGKTVEEIPAIIRKPISATAKLPFTLKNASLNQLKMAADILKKSSNPSVQKFGENMSEEAMKTPAMRNAIIHSAFQREDIRRALGLSLGEEEKEE